MNNDNFIIYGNENDNFKIVQRKKDLFIYANEMAKLCNKKIWDFIRTNQTKKYIKYLLEDLQINQDYKLDYVYETIKGGEPKYQGTFMHPYLLTYFANWLSPYFAVKVSKWIEEWKLITQENKNNYYSELQNIKIDCGNNLIEKEIQDILAKQLNGKKEIETQFGYIDLLTDYSIIEIKHFSNWKQALGQILCYSQEYPNKNKIIYLFDYDYENKDYLQLIEKTFLKFNVKLILYS